MPEREETALVSRETKESLSVLRIYLRRRTTIKQAGVRGWFKRKALSILPTCVELVADRAVLDAFVDAFAHELVDAVLVRFDGAAVSLSPMDLS